MCCTVFNKNEKEFCIKNLSWRSDYLNSYLFYLRNDIISFFGDNQIYLSLFRIRIGVFV